MSVNLICNDGISSVQVSKKHAMLSKLVATMLEGMEQEEVTDVPLPNVTKDILSRIMEFMVYYDGSPMSEIEKPLKSANMSDNISDPWYVKFIDLPQDVIMDIILAANYMDIKPLLDLSCAKIASMLKGKTPEEIRATFNIVNDFTPEEEAQVREENKWCEE